MPAACRAPVRFVLQGEISSIYKHDEVVRKVHNLVYCPDLETAGRFCKATTTPVLALDLPSGLEADSGRAAPEALTCAATVTFVAPKLGFCLRPATALVGTVEVVGIGLPERWMASIL